MVVRIVLILADIQSFRTKKEILMYPYSGFRVKKVFPDNGIIELDCVDTLQVESYTQHLIPREVKLFDEGRQIYVYFYKRRKPLHISLANHPDQRALIAQNPSGYWATHYHYHHKNGYFISKGSDVWEEHHNNTCVARFRQV